MDNETCYGLALISTVALFSECLGKPFLWRFETELETYNESKMDLCLICFVTVSTYLVESNLNFKGPSIKFNFPIVTGH